MYTNGISNFETGFEWASDRHLFKELLDTEEPRYKYVFGSAFLICPVA